MYRIKVAFNRQANVIETGTCTVTVKDPNDMREINQKLNNKDFSGFLVTDREYDDDDDWEFELPDEDGGDIVA